MPELPEVETVKNTLLRQIIKKPITHVHVNYAPMIKNMEADEFVARMQNNTVQDISRRGKHLIFHLADGILLSHLRMEGKYFYVDSDVPQTTHTHVVFTFEDGMQLFYEDTRKFGTFHFYETEAQLQSSKSFQMLGVEPFAAEFTAPYVKEKLSHKKKPIKSTLLDQTIVTGLGNIYVDEVLYRANVHPLTPAGQLTDAQIEAVVNETKNVLARAIELKGTTIRTFASQHGSGTYQNELRVHQRANEPCATCQTPIQKIKVGGRGTYFCEVCQPEVKE